MKSLFEKAIERTVRINLFLRNRDWRMDCSTRPLLTTQVEILRLQQEGIRSEITRLKRYAEECQLTIDDNLYTSPFGPNGQEKIKTTAKDRQEAGIEWRKITKAIEDLENLRYEIKEEEANCYAS